MTADVFFAASSCGKVRALVSMAGTLLSCTGFDPADYDALATKTAQYAAKLLKKPDQCRMVTLCSHLFWSHEEVRQYCVCKRRSVGVVPHYSCIGVCACSSFWCGVRDVKSNFDFVLF